MKLYHAQQEAPELSNPAMEEELAALEKERDSGPPGEYMVDAFTRMGKEKYVRLIELRQIVKEQRFFVRSASTSRFLAGTHRYLVEIDLPEEDAMTHIVSVEEVTAGGGQPDDEGDNFAFTGQELAKNAASWQYEVTDLEPE